MKSLPSRSERLSFILQFGLHHCIFQLVLVLQDISYALPEIPLLILLDLYRAGTIALHCPVNAEVTKVLEETFSTSYV